MSVQDFVAVEDGPTTYSVTVYTADGDSHIVSSYTRKTHAEQAVEAIRTALLTWPGWQA